MPKQLLSQEGASSPNPVRRRRRRRALRTAAIDGKVSRVVSGARRRAWRKRQQHSATGESSEINRQKSGFWFWSFFGLSAIALLGGMSAGAVFLLARVPQSPDCQTVSPLSTPAERLYCAEQTARSGELEPVLAAVALVQHWTPKHPLYPEGQRLLAEWSEKLLAIADRTLRQGDLEGAIAIAQQIPESSPLHPQLEATIASWVQNWQQGQAIYDSAQAAIKAQDWKAASTHMQTLSQVENIHWQQRLTQLGQQVNAEQAAWKRLRQAQALAKVRTMDALTQAIALAQQIGIKSYARPEAQAEIVRWSRALLTLANNRLTQKNLSSAIAAASQVPANSSLSDEAQDFIQLGRARAATWENTLLALVEAQAIADKILPGRPLYQQAQKLIAAWQLELQDRMQLRLAKSTASFGQIPTFRLAIEQAQMVDLGNPQRLQAQTLIAQWRKDIQRLEDRPYLVRARQLAEPATLETLRLAIAEASQVEIGRPLRIEAQTLIAQWNNQIEVIEDRPFLEQARALAQAGELINAIQTAQNIQAGRALYPEAQTEIQEWTRQLQIAADRPILQEAAALARRGRLTQAIRKASKISSGRPLYREAQRAIATWARERDAILARRAAARKRAAEEQNTEQTPNED